MTPIRRGTAARLGLDLPTPPPTPITLQEAIADLGIRMAEVLRTMRDDPPKITLPAISLPKATRRD